jgi:hypothetical protein
MTIGLRSAQSGNLGLVARFNWSRPCTVQPQKARSPFILVRVGSTGAGMVVPLVMIAVVLDNEDRC